jgi:hypothetical protein
MAGKKVKVSRTGRNGLSRRPKTGEILSEKMDGEETASVGGLFHSMSR